MWWKKSLIKKFSIPFQPNAPQTTEQCRCQRALCSFCFPKLVNLINKILYLSVLWVPWPLLWSIPYLFCLTHLDINDVSWILCRRNISGQEFGGMYCIVLIVKYVAFSIFLIFLIGLLLLHRDIGMYHVTQVCCSICRTT